jgi:hypothetical protein
MQAGDSHAFVPARTSALAQIEGMSFCRTASSHLLARQVLAAAIEGHVTGRALRRLIPLAGDGLLGTDPAPERRGRVRAAGKVNCGLRVHRCARAT